MLPSEFVRAYSRCPGEIPPGLVDAEGTPEAQQLRWLVAKELYWRADAEDLALARHLLAEAIKANGRGAGVDLALKTLCLLLFLHGNVEDAAHIWSAKCANLDTFDSIDVQFMVAAGVQRTMRFLHEIGDANLARSPRDGQGALEYLRRCESAGDLEPGILACTESVVGEFEDDYLR